MKVVSEDEFIAALSIKLAGLNADGVTGPGRSGAIAAVYASYLLRIPFIPFGQPFPQKLLVIDTVSQSGKTIRKAERQLIKIAAEVQALTVFSQPERLHFWFEFPEKA